MNTQHTVSWCILKYRLYVSINFWILWSDAMVFASLLLKMVHCKWTGAGVLLTALGSDQKGRLAEQMLSFHSLNLPHSSLSPCFTVTCLVFNPGVLILLPPLLSFMFYINIKITYFFFAYTWGLSVTYFLILQVPMCLNFLVEAEWRFVRHFCPSSSLLISPFLVTVPSRHSNKC